MRMRAAGRILDDETSSPNDIGQLSRLRAGIATMARYANSNFEHELGTRHWERRTEAVVLDSQPYVGRVSRGGIAFAHPFDGDDDRPHDEAADRSQGDRSACKREHRQHRIDAHVPRGWRLLDELDDDGALLKEGEHLLTL